ncbi:SGNH/GDSL hydrolase family protein [Gemmata sp.]|uniref:SGNH/GDSL hydrolase family protein n=1 Tax=Gemmata sp. TaxID=1914242 RepID=UPI003F6FA8C4
MTRLPLFALATACAAVAWAAPAEGPIIATMDELTFAAPKGKGTAELVEGKVGRAVKFTLDTDARSAFFTSRVRGTAEWDRAAGFSFWVKGDGTDGFAGLQLIHDDDFAVRYDLCFPVKGKEWQKVTAAWADLVPVLPGPKARPLGAGGNAPSKVSALWFGKWWYWGDYPAHTFTVDEIRLEPAIERDAKDDKPDGDPLARVRAKLRAGKPVSVVTMGDSLTDVRHHANRKTNWPTLLAETAKAAHGSEVAVHNPAIGGTQLRQNLVLIPRWLDAVPEPDLVTVWFGGNDWGAGMRGPEFEAACGEAVDRGRRSTKGKADVLLLTTCPSAAAWDTTAPLAEAVRKAAKEKNAGVADVAAAFGAVAKDGRERLFVADRVHLSPDGHALAAGTVLKAIGPAP